jgi:plastocyanin
MKLTRLPILVVAFVAACGGDGGTDPGPTQVLESITIAPSPLNLVAGFTTTLTVTGTDTQGQPVTGLSGVTLTSQNTAVVETSGTEALGISAGSTTITVSASKGGATKQATVTANVTGTLPNENSVTAGSPATVFTPQTVAVARTGMVTWTFGALIHNVTFSGVNGAPANIPDASNTAVSRTFNTAGNFPYQCMIHPGMSGLVIVR